MPGRCACVCATVVCICVWKYFYVHYSPMVQAANLSYELDSCQSTIESSCFNKTENSTMMLLDECWPRVEELESSTGSCLSRWFSLRNFIRFSFHMDLSLTQSCSCWESVREARREFQQRCMNSSSPGDPTFFLQLPIFSPVVIQPFFNFLFLVIHPFFNVLFLAFLQW